MEREEEFDRVDKMDWYLAAIAAKIDSTKNLRYPEEATAENNILTFSTPKPKIELTDEQKMERAMLQKVMWMAMAGLDPDGNKI